MNSNLYSLLSSKWMLEPTEVPTMLHLLNGILNNQANTDNLASEAIYPFIVTQTKQIIRTKVVYGEVILPDASEPYILVYPIKSSIYKYNQSCGPVGTTTHKQRLSTYLNNPNCTSVILDIDSGGGQVSGTPNFYDFINKATKPIHAFTDGYMCSAAYYIGSACKSITADPRAEKIGSIGALVYFIDQSGILEKQGAKIITQYATKSTKKNSAIRSLLEGEPEEYLKTELDPVVDSFINDVRAKRSNVNEEVFTGDTYNAEDSLANGLIDNISSLEDLIDSLLTPPNKSSTPKGNTNSMKQYANLNTVLAVEALEGTDKGTYLNEEQLETINSALAGNTAIVEQLTAAAATSDNILENLTSKLGSLMTLSGLEASEDQEANFTALSDHIADLNKKPGNAHTQASGNTNPPVEDKESIIDMEARHNQLANSIFN